MRSYVFDFRGMVRNNLPAQIAENPDGSVAFGRVERLTVFARVFNVKSSDFDLPIIAVNAHIV